MLFFFELCGVVPTASFFGVRALDADALDLLEVEAFFVMVF